MSTPIVTTKQGKLVGAVVESNLGATYLAFKGIPFAAPPLGILRFKDPQLPSSWTGIREAGNIHVNCCIQWNEFPPFGIIGSEDCLYLNVYTTALTGRKPVVVWIHGGSFLLGAGTNEFVRPDYIIDKDIVFVAVNYRLGVLGFLNSGDRIASGNQGFKDQVAALRWIQENISNFGGDPQNVTIVGASAGGTSVHLLTLSPMSKGLFHKAIIQSGSVNAVWMKHASLPEYCFKLASLLGKNSNDPKEVVEFLQTVPAEKLVEQQRNIIDPKISSLAVIGFGVNVDDFAKEPFLPEPWEKTTPADSNIPVIIGYCSHEFIMFMKDDKEATLHRYRDNLDGRIKALLDSNSPEKLDTFAKEVKKEYFGDKPVDKETVPLLVNLLGDAYFVKPLQEVAYDRVKRKCVAPTYVYRFSYVGNECTMTRALIEKPVMKGASHVDDTSYFLYRTRCKAKQPEPPKVGTKDWQMMQCFTRMIANFAKTGNPTPSTDEYISTIWKPVREDNFTVLDIGDDLRNVPADTKLLKICERYA